MKTTILLVYLLCSSFEFMTECKPSHSLRDAHSNVMSKQDNGDTSDLGLLVVMIRHVEGRMKNLETFVEKSINEKGMI